MASNGEHQARLALETAMSGFNLAELLPFYLDETDEHIAGAQRLTLSP